MTKDSERRHRFPMQFALQDRTVVFQPLTSGCRDAVLSFARDLSEEDLLFLDRDISEPAVVDQWIKDVSDGNLTTIAAWQDDSIIGYATIYRGNASWTSHVAELRVVVAESVRGIGLGRLLLELVFEMALEWGVTKVVARMTPDQTSAIKLFKRLGFREEAILRDNAMDANGLTHDLLVFTFHASDHSDSHCGSCGLPVLAALTLDGMRLCSHCFESRYEELGSGD